MTATVTAISSRKCGKIGIGRDRFVHDLGIGHGQHPAVVGHDARGAQGDPVDAAVLAVDFHQVVDGEGAVQKNQDAGDDVGKRIAQGETDCQAGHAQRTQQRRGFDARGAECSDHAEAEHAEFDDGLGKGDAGFVETAFQAGRQEPVDYAPHQIEDRQNNRCNDDIDEEFPKQPPQPIEIEIGFQA